MNPTTNANFDPSNQKNKQGRPPEKIKANESDTTSRDMSGVGDGPSLKMPDNAITGLDTKTKNEKNQDARTLSDELGGV